jgi:hypothetical protein
MRLLRNLEGAIFIRIRRKTPALELDKEEQDPIVEIEVDNITK